MKSNKSLKTICLIIGLVIILLLIKYIIYSHNLSNDSSMATIENNKSNNNIIVTSESTEADNISDKVDNTSDKIDNTSDKIDNTLDKVNNTSEIPPIIWLGDSLTQGSLGDDNGNENNPQAPWRILKDISGYDVEGYGYYGYNTHDILWKFGEDGGKKEADKIYIFWVGSNDFYVSPSNISNVISEINNFLQNGNIDKYLVLGTTNRGDMDPTAYISINKEFEDNYSPNYLDIMPYVEYGPDGIHLTESAYKSIAEAVYDKLSSSYH